MYEVRHGKTFQEGSILFLIVRLNLDSNLELALLKSLLFNGTIYLLMVSLFIINTYSSCTAALLTCTFEKSLCNWSQSKSDKFDWTRRSGSTPSSGTGPSQSSTGPNGMVTVSVKQNVIFVTLL